MRISRERYCRANGLVSHQMAYWTRKFAEHDCEPSEKQLVPVQITQTSKPKAKISFGAEIVLELDGQVCPRWLGQVIEAARGLKVAGH